MFKKIIIIIFLITIFFSIGYFLIMAYPDFKSSNSAPENEKPLQVTLEFWGVWDDSDHWDATIQKFEEKIYDLNGQKVTVSINYTKKELGSYEKEMSDLKQKNNEPNIFMIDNNWLERYVEQLEPLNENNAYAKEYEIIQYDKIGELFPVEIIRDLFYDNKLYGLPFYSDSLALYYNKDLLKNAEIETPPATWQEFNLAIRKLTEVNRKNEIVQAGAALGCGENINRSSDILALLMLQGGTKIIDTEKNIDFNQEIEVNTLDGPEKRTPGEQAILFYTDFANPKKEIYTWNKDQNGSLRAFANGEVALLISYGYQMKNLMALNPDLNYGVSPMPQLENSSIVNFANVWTPVVSKNNNCQVEPPEASSKVDCAKIAWSFLSFANEKENLRPYLASTQKAAARKDLLAEQIELDNEVSVFASQAESALSYNKFDDQIDGILVRMIDKINADRNNWKEKIDEAVAEIEKLIPTL